MLFERIKRAISDVIGRRLALAPNDLLRDAVYRRLWTSILISSFGGQVTLLALPLTAAVLLHATPTQMGLLTAMEIAPFVLFSLPSGLWLDRVPRAVTAAGCHYLEGVSFSINGIGIVGSIA